MRRRKMMKVMAATGTMLWLPSAGCGDGDAPVCPPEPDPSDDPFDSWAPTGSEDDIRLVVLSYALLAPNPHNIQPWWVQLRSPTELDVYVDPERLLPLTDPPFRQVHIGTGTFLELLSLAAGAHGHRANVELFPEGEYDNVSLDDRPVARVALEMGGAEDPLFDSIMVRRSDKEPYDMTPVDTAVLTSMAETAGVGPAVFSFAQDPSMVAEIAQVALDAMYIELSSPARNEETINTWRFTDEELAEHRSGMDARFLQEVGFTRDALIGAPEAFREEGVTLHESRVMATPAFGWMTTPSNSRRDQVALGRQYARFNLAGAAAGVSMHPVSQVLQEYDDMRALQASFKELVGARDDETVQMLLRLGYGPDDPVSARRRWSDFSRC